MVDNGSVEWGSDRLGGTKMQFIKPLIISDSLPDALAQIGQLRDRLKVAFTYNGRPLTPKMRARLMTMLDEMEQDEIKRARDREQERLSRATEKFAVVIKEREAGLAAAAAAARALAEGVAKIAASHAIALDAARETGSELPDIKVDVQKLAQAAAEALKPLAAITEAN